VPPITNSRGDDPAAMSTPIPDVVGRAVGVYQAARSVARVCETAKVLG